MGEGSKKLQQEGERGRTVRSGEITEGISCQRPALETQKSGGGDGGGQEGVVVK